MTHKHDLYLNKPTIITIWFFRCFIICHPVTVFLLSFVSVFVVVVQMIRSCVFALM